MANIPPQENWFAIAAEDKTVSSAGAIVISYTCPRNRCAVLTGWGWDEGDDSSTMGVFYNHASATGTPPKAILVAKSDADISPSATNPNRQMLDVRMGPGDTVSVRGITLSYTPSWDFVLFIREIGPVTQNMGSWTES